MTKMKIYTVDISYETFVEEQIEAESMEDANIIARDIARQIPGCYFPRIKVEDDKQND